MSKKDTFKLLHVFGEFRAIEKNIDEGIAGIKGVLPDQDRITTLLSYKFAATSLRNHIDGLIEQIKEGEL